MRALKWSVCLSLILAFYASSVAWAGDIEHQYGIELRGGYGLYIDNTDPNTFAKDFEGNTTGGYSQEEYTESLGAFTGGLSLLYKSRDYFGWHIGLNVLGTDSATATAVKANSPDQSGRVFISAVEIFLTANYYWHLSPRLNLQIGAGPAFYLASLDREATAGSEAIYGSSFYGAHGRSFGFTGSMGAEFFLSNALSVRFGGGFRWAPIDRFKYFQEETDEDGTHKEGMIAYWANPDGTPSYDTFEANFSGIFAEIGFRIYFESAAKWKKYD